jgi:CRP-like cAMP-binding protein
MLSALSALVTLRRATQIELVHLSRGTVLYESGAKLNCVYFPEDSIVSLLFVLENGSTTEIAVVGHEGLVGISIFMGGDTTPNRAVFQSAGCSLRVLSSYVKA